MNTDATRTADPCTATGDVVNALRDLLTHSAPTAGAVVAAGVPDLPPGFVLEREIGVGGMGVVYLARQLGLNRPVALKLVKGSEKVDAKALIRFLAEAEAVAAVRHPNVVEVYQYGDHQGRPYMALEYCPGGDLTTLTKAEQTRDASWFRKVAHLMAKVADGVNAAHAQGIVHRDLKPHNVFLTADGTPKVADFGLAKRGLGSDLTNTEAVMGTPAYMAPEQAGGGTKFLGPEADVWALGVMLYELLSGERPLDTTGPLLDAIARVARGEVSLLRTKVPTVPPDLALITHKSLSRDPRDRYPTAGGLASDLRNWLDGQPISVRPVGMIESAVKWVRRKPTLATAYVGSVAAVTLLFVVFILVSLWQQAEGAKQLATQAQEKVARVEYGRTMQIVHHRWVENDAAEAVALLADTDPRLRGWEWDYLHRLCNEHVLEVKRVHLSDLSGDGTRLATAESTERGDRIVLWAVPSGEKLFELPIGHHNSKQVQFSGDGRRLLTASYGTDGAVARVWDTATGQEVAHFPTTDPSFATLTLDGRRVFASDKEVVNVWEVDGGQKLAALGGHIGNGVFGIWASPGGSWAVTRYYEAGQSDRYRVWDLTGREPTCQPLEGHLDSIREVEFSRDAKTLCSISSGETILRDPSGAIRTRVPKEMASGSWLALSGDGRCIVSVGHNETLRLWEEGKGLRWVSPTGQASGAYRFALSADGRRVVTVSNDMSAKVWDADTGKELHHLKGHTGGIQRVAVSADGNVVLTQTADTVRVWDTRRPTGAQEPERTPSQNHECEVEWAGRRIKVRSFSSGTGFGWTLPQPPLPESEKLEGGAFSRDGRVAAVAFSGGRVLLWDRQAGRAIATLTADSVVRPLLVFSPDGSKLFCAGKAGGQVWEANTGTRLGSVAHGENVGIASAAFSPDGTTLATGFHDNTARLHDARTGALIAQLKGHTKSVDRLAFDPTGKRLATASYDNTVRLWDAATGKELAVMKGHTAEITSVAFHPDGNRVVTGAKDRTVRVWDTVSGAGVYTHKEAKADGWGLFARFSEDGKELLTTLDDETTLKVWDSRPVARGPPTR